MRAARELHWAAVILFCMAAAPPALGQTGGDGDRLELDLEQAVRLALTSSRDAIKARLGREEQELELEAAEQRYDPMLSLGAGVNARNREETSADVSLGPSLRVRTGGTFRLSWHKPVAGEQDRDASAVLGFSQPLLKGFGTDVDTAPLIKARLAERINVGVFRDRVAGIVDAVIDAYRGALSARRRVAITSDALERAHRQLEVNRALIDAGRMAPQDAVQTEAEVANREYALIDAENALETANAALVNVLDLADGTRVEPREEPDVAPRLPGLEESLETAFARRTDWLKAETGVELARIELGVARNNLLPDLSLDVTVSQAGGREKTNWSGSLSLTVPLLDKEPERALARARNDVRRAEMMRAETRQVIGIEVRRAVQDVSVALRRIQLARQARELAERKVDIERLKLREGLSSAFQLGRFEDDLVAAQNRELDAVVGYSNALTGLDRTLGTTLDRWGIGIERVGR